MYLLDGDIIAYRVAFKTEDDTDKRARYNAGSFIASVLTNLACKRRDVDDIGVLDYQVFISGRTNFRSDIAYTQKYKGNRDKQTKPKRLEVVRNHLVREYGAIVSEHEEADDLIAIWATDYGDDAVICSNDKDFDQVPGWHYNFVKDTLYYVDEATARKNFYISVLVGDQVDNIKGANRIGKVKAPRVLEDCVSEDDYYAVCLDAFDNDEQRLIETCRLLWLRRTPGELWTPPREREHG